MFIDLHPGDWGLLALAALGLGVSKSGLAGVSMLHVLIFAHVFGAKVSTGVVLPLLVVGDLCAIRAFGDQAQWSIFRRLLPPALIGVVIGTGLMGYLDERQFRPLVGGIILTLTLLQLLRLWRPTALERIPHSSWFAWSLGLLAGITTMLANAAGPIVALYLLAVALPKLELVGTGAWLFLAINLFKLPFSAWALGLITPESLAINAVLAPIVPLGLVLGGWLVRRISQFWFNVCLLAFTGAISLRLVGLY
ncbi:MAG: sulfite exporter TauE/SafE family protein [Pirellulaceae bacterium]|nr:sulfite exporter TauE/SafE family protein [Pirellulaceae bacterium]